MSTYEQSLPHALDIEQKETLSTGWLWFVVLGGLTLAAGFFAMVAPGVAALAVEIVLGATLLANGVLRAIQAARLRRWPGNGARILNSIVSLGIGALLLAFPLTGVVTLALLAGAYFIAGAVLNGITAWQGRGQWGAGALALSAVFSLVLGILVLAVWPQMAPAVIGILVGVELLIAGAWLIALGLAARTWSPS